MSNDIEADYQRELTEIEAESLGWTPLEPGVYLHVSDANAAEVLVVGGPASYLKVTGSLCRNYQH